MWRWICMVLLCIMHIWSRDQVHEVSTDLKLLWMSIHNSLYSYTIMVETYVCEMWIVAICGFNNVESCDNITLHEIIPQVYVCNMFLFFTYMCVFVCIDVIYIIHVCIIYTHPYIYIYTYIMFMNTAFHFYCDSRNSSV